MYLYVQLYGREKNGYVKFFCVSHQCKNTRASSFYRCFTILRLRKCGIICTRFRTIIRWRKTGMLKYFL